MKKGQIFFHWGTVIIATVIMLIIIILVNLNLGKIGEKNTEEIKFDMNKYLLRQELNQFLNSYVEINNNNFSVADAISALMTTQGTESHDDVEKVMQQAVKDYFGEGDIFTQKIKKNNDLNLVFIYVTDTSLTTSLRDGYQDNKENIANSNYFFPVAPTYNTNFYGTKLVAELFRERLLSANFRFLMKINPEVVLKWLDEDESHDYYATNLIGMDNDVVTVLFIRRHK